MELKQATARDARTKTACIACGYEDLQHVRSYRTESSYGEDVFGDCVLAECPQCRLVQAIPRPSAEALDHYYAEDYRLGILHVAGADVADLSAYPKDNLYYFNRGQSIAQLLGSFVQKKAPRILDVGAGYGHILYALGQQFPEAERVAVEYSEVCLPFLENLGIEVIPQPVEEALQHNTEPFDVVVLSHVLEHLLDPVSVLELLHAHLAPGGVLYVEVPNIPRASLLKYPDHVWAPRFDEPHLTFYSQPTLERVLERAGFEVELCRTAGGEYKHISWLRFHLPHWRWFIQQLMPSALFNFLRSSRLTKSVRVQEREESFYQYGGDRIWLRSVSRKRDESPT